MRLQSAIFDMDGTLLDSMPTWRELGPTFLKEAGISATPEQDRMLHILADCDVIPYLREVCGLPWSQQEIIDQIIQRMETFYSSQVRPKPGLEKFLSILKMEGVWMYVATATHRRLTEKALKTAGIDHYFRGIVTSADAGNHKSESADIYEMAMRRLQSNKRDTVVFEDALHAIRTAKAAGFRVAGVYEATAGAGSAGHPAVMCGLLHPFLRGDWSSLRPSEHRKRSRMGSFSSKSFSGTL